MYRCVLAHFLYEIFRSHNQLFIQFFLLSIKKIVYFLNLVYKVIMADTFSQIRRTMVRMTKATRPQLAKATGLSLVTVNRAVKYLCLRGELQRVGAIASGGGRPVQLYQYNTQYAQHVLLEVRQEGSLLRCKLTLMDLVGTYLLQQENSFAYIEQESLDGWLDTVQHHKQLQSITLLAPISQKTHLLAQHLAERYHCRVNTPSSAALLSIGERGHSCPLPSSWTCTLLLYHSRAGKSSRNR